MTAAEPTIDRSTTRHSGVLDSLPSRQRTTGEQAAARSRLVRRLRVMLPAIAVLLVFAFFRNMQSDQADATWLEDFKLDAAPEELEMANPRFSGVDAEGRPFVITAEGVTQSPDQESSVSLRMPRALTNSDDETSVVYANAGVYDSDNKVLALEDEVTFEHILGADKYILVTPEATVVIDEHRVETVAGVEGSASDGSTIAADEMRAFQDENRVLFEGNVRLKIVQPPAGAAAPLPNLRRASPDATQQERPLP